MNWFKNISMRNKLFFSFGLLFGCLAIVIGTAFTAITSVMTVQETLFSVELPLTAELMTYRTSLNRQRAVFTEAVAARTVAEKMQWLNNMKDVDQIIDSSLQSLQTLAERVPDVKSDVLKLKGLNDEYLAIRNKEFIPLLSDEKHASQAIDMIGGVLNTKYEEIRKILLELSNVSQGHDQKLMQRARDMVQTAFTLFWAVGVIGLLLAIFMTIAIVASMANPIRELSAFAERVAYGDLTVVVSTETRADEVGKLQYTFGMMVSALKQITQEVRSVAETLIEDVAAAGRFAGEASGGEGGEKTAVFARLEELGERLKKLISEYKL